MIVELNIKNVALISELNLVLGEGFSVLTGETGAGKSILLGALSLLLGERANIEIIRADCDRAVVEGIFSVTSSSDISELLAKHGLPEIEEQQLLIKREILRAGKSKCYVNGSLTTLSILHKIGERLVDLHGQHEHQLLMRSECQRDMLDTWGDLLALRLRVKNLYTRLKEVKSRKEKLTFSETERTRQLDLLDFQIAEIDKIDIKLGEISTLSQERNKLLYTERLANTCEQVLQYLHRQENIAVRDILAKSVVDLNKVVTYAPELEGVVDKISALEAQLEDVVVDLDDFMSSLESDPGRLEIVEDRLASIQKLTKKYGEQEEEILAYREKIIKEREQLRQQEENLEVINREEQTIIQELSQQSKLLSQQRKQIGEDLAEKVSQVLRTLGFKQAEFKVEVTSPWLLDENNLEIKWGPEGVDEVAFLISANPGEPAQPVNKIASGGELSRIMLAIKVIAAQADKVPSMIFDEIDSGIGGVTAEIVGRKLLELSLTHQVLVITHLPQIARFAKHHFKVEKKVVEGRTITMVKVLTQSEREQELARMLAGDSITDTALKHAKELLN